MKLKNRFKLIREELKLTQKEFSQKIKIGQSTMAQLESGVREINDRHIKLICDEFNVNENWIRTGIGNMFNTAGNLLELITQSIPTLDEMDKKFITEYVKLSPEQKKMFKGFLKSMMD